MYKIPHAKFNGYTVIFTQIRGGGQIDPLPVGIGVTNRPVGIGLKKLEIPNFNSDHREYFKWKEMFERYTRN